MHIIDLNCTGSELRVLDCPHNGLSGVHTCDHRQDASIRCQGTNFIQEPRYLLWTLLESQSFNVALRSVFVIACN